MSKANGGEPTTRSGQERLPDPPAQGNANAAKQPGYVLNAEASRSRDINIALSV